MAKFQFFPYYAIKIKGEICCYGYFCDLFSEVSPIGMLINQFGLFVKLLTGYDVAGSRERL